MASTSQASAPQYKGPCDVFLSFRGPDARHAIVSHIYEALRKAGISTFRDDEKLMKGEPVSPEVFSKAIKDSRAAVIIFTRDFAASPWCLREVDKIMECKETNELLVLPVFYCVNPQELRTPRSEYREALDRHERKYKEVLDRHEKEYKEALDDGHEKEYKDALEKYEKARKNLEEVKRWEKALSEAGSLYGSEFNVWVVKEGTTIKSENGDTKVVEKETTIQSENEDTKAAAKGIPIQVQNRDTKVNMLLRDGTTFQTGGRFRNEAELVESIVREIWIRLDPIPLDVGEFQVGIDSRVDQLIEKFDLKSKENTLKLGLWAMGGMGKTTLAKALYNKIFKDFDGSAYVDGIKGTKQQTEAMFHLQERLLSQMLLAKEIKLSSDAKGSSRIQERLRGKRVLLILDGVDDECQINSLARKNDWFAAGSKIIFTTTNKLLLNGEEVKSHTVQPLEDSEARELFMNHACKKGYKIIGEHYIRRALLCTYGVPLALEVLGGDFANNEEGEWEGRLKEFTRSSSESIDAILRVCYEGLNKDEKRIFLYIACFFNGWSRRYVEGVLKKCGLSGDTIVSNLIGRSFIADENGILKMHELIELMGKNIVDEECDGDAARSSRLWRLEDVKKVLSRDKESDKVNAIVLALPKLETVNIRLGAFAKLINLKFLIMINVKADFRDPLCLPAGLMWFEWPQCSPSRVELNSENNLTFLVRRHLLEQGAEEP